MDREQIKTILLKRRPSCCENGDHCKGCEQDAELAADEILALDQPSPSALLSPEEICRAFVERVNLRAEKNMLRTGKLEGMHKLAMDDELKSMKDSMHALDLSRVQSLLETHRGKDSICCPEACCCWDIEKLLEGE